jgi:hypothetical protein
VQRLRGTGQLGVRRWAIVGSALAIAISGTIALGAPAVASVEGADSRQDSTT